MTSGWICFQRVWMGLTDNWRIAKILTDKKNSFNNYINWFWLINYASIISDVMKSLSEGSLHESVSHKLNSRGASTIPSPPSRGSLLIQFRRHSLLSVLVVVSDSINLLPKPLVKWSLGTRDCLKFNRQLTFTLGFTVKWQRTWLFFTTRACVSSETHNLQRVFRPGGGGTPLYGLYRYKRRQRVWFFSLFGLK